MCLALVNGPLCSALNPMCPLWVSLESCLAPYPWWMSLKTHGLALDLVLPFAMLPSLVLQLLSVTALGDSKYVIQATAESRYSLLNSDSSLPLSVPCPLCSSPVRMTYTKLTVWQGRWNCTVWGMTYTDTKSMVIKTHAFILCTLGRPMQ